MQQRLGWTAYTPAARRDGSQLMNDTRRYLLERVDDAAVVQLYADGFAQLSLRDKILVWHLYLAALAGRDIYYDQRYAHNLEMRRVARGDPDARERRRSARARTRSAATRSCSGSTPVPTTTSPHESSSCA